MEPHSTAPAKAFPGIPAWLACALLVSIAFALNAAALHFGFVWDDTGYIRENFRIHALDWIHIKAIWIGTYLGHYAPFHHLFLALVYSIDGNQPFYFHLANLLVHLAAVVLAYLLIKRLESPAVALLTCLLYIVHPTHPETVAWISESKSTLSFLFFLISAWYFLNFSETRRPGFLALSVIFFVCAGLTKINTVVAPAIFFLHEYRVRRSIREISWPAMGLFAITSLILVRAHLQAFGANLGMLDGIPYASLGVRLMNLPMLLSFYLDTALAPYNLSAWQQFPVQQDFTWVVGLAWLGLALMGYFLLRAAKAVQFWAGWFIIFLVPVLQFVPFPIWVADRYLYIPLLGGSVLMAKLVLWGWDKLASPVKRAGLAAAVGAFFLVLSWQSLAHLGVWRDELTLWGSAIRKCGKSAYCHNSYGLALMAAGRMQQGGEALEEAVRISPTPVFLGHLGDALTVSARNYPEAIRIYKLALKDAGKPGEDPYSLRNGSLLAKLARAYMKQDDLDLAEHSIRLGVAYEFRNPLLATADTFLQWKRGNLQAARGSLDTVSIMTGKVNDLEAYMNQFWADIEETRRMMRDVLQQPRQVHLAPAGR